MKSNARRVLWVAVAVAVVLGGTGASAGTVLAPTANWCHNRFADFMDIFSIGAGMTFENKLGGPIPPSIGAYAEATCLLSLGAITHNGGTIEWDGRGAGIYTESRTLYGLGPYRGWKINQGDQIVNYYKDAIRSQVWAQRMQTDLRSSALGRVNRWIANTEIGNWCNVTEVGGCAAKQPIHRDTSFHTAFLGTPRGWQTWEYIGGEVAICEPFLTHMGVTVRVGIDPSEIFDFLLGFVGIDFRQDDRKLGE